MLVDLQCWDAGDDDAPKRIADDGRWSLTDSNTHLQFGCCWRRDVPAGVVKSVDTQDLGSCDESRGGSSPSARTTRISIASEPNYSGGWGDLPISRRHSFLSVT